jgi:hypothetical protein
VVQRRARLQSILISTSIFVLWKKTCITDLGVLENEQICLVVSLQEFEVELHRFLSGENLSKLVVGRLRCLGGNETNGNLV